MASPDAATKFYNFCAAILPGWPGVILTKLDGKVELKKKGELRALNIMGVAYAEDGSVSARFSEIL
jgi:hypothetical protein